MPEESFTLARKARPWLLKFPPSPMWRYFAAVPSSVKLLIPCFDAKQMEKERKGGRPYRLEGQFLHFPNSQGEEQLVSSGDCTGGSSKDTLVVEQV